VIYLADCPFRILHFTHHSADLSAYLDSSFYFPHSAIPHFTNNHQFAPVTNSPQVYGVSWYPVLPARLGGYPGTTE